MAKKYDKEQLLADYKTGAYTQRQIAHKYSLSPAMIAKLVKGVSKDLESVVNADIHVKHTLASKSEQEVSAVSEVVSREVSKLLKAKKLDDFLDNAAGLAAKRSVEILSKKDLSMIEIEQFSKAQNNIRVGIGTQQKFATSTQITNNNAQQNNEPVKRVFHVVE